MAAGDRWQAEIAAAKEALIRASLEAAAQIAKDAADRIIAVLDRMDGDPDFEDGADAEPSLAAPENQHASQVGWMRGGDQDREVEAPEIALPDVVVTSPVSRVRLAALASAPLAWRGSASTR